MSVAGIIAEFDPFHNGHQYLIDTVRRELSPRAVVCVMSGNFTQRGEPAILDKFTRAQLAIKGGADLVVELPVCCAVNAAREFAFGGAGKQAKLLAAEGVEVTNGVVDLSKYQWDGR